MTNALSPRDQIGAETLAVMAEAPRFNTWMYDTIEPWLGRRILEVGSGIGNMSAELLKRADHLVVTDLDPWYRGQLAHRFAARPQVRVEQLELPDAGARDRFAADRLDTVVALNVVEHIEDDVAAVRSMGELVVPGGRVVVLVPALPGLYGELDRQLGHYRRYTRRSLGSVFTRAGLRMERLFWFNRVGILGWWFNGRIRRLKQIPLSQLRSFDALVPLLRLEQYLKLPFGQSLIAVGTPAC